MEKYAALMVRIEELLTQKGWSQKELAKNMGQKPSAISRWLNGSGNLTLRTIAKMEAELEEDLIQIPQTTVFNSALKTVEVSPMMKFRRRNKKVKAEPVLKTKAKTISFPLEINQRKQTELFENNSHTSIQKVG